MKKYIEVSPVEKLKLLNEHALFVGAEWTHLDQLKWCLHCESQFSGHSVRIYSDGSPGVWLECGTPGCNGSPIDWSSDRWWRPEKKKRKPKSAKPKR